MVLINKAINEVTVKLVYYGPGLCGKTTNLEKIYGNPKLENKGKMISMSTETDRTLFFDFMPMELGTIAGQKVRVQLYTVPGQVFYDATRKLVLRGADGVVFVADSQDTMRESNLESLDNLRTNLRLNRIDPEKIALVFQYNKRDLPNIESVEDMNAYIEPGDAPVVEASAINGTGVTATLRAAIVRILDNVKKNVDTTLPEGAPLAAPDMRAKSGVTPSSGAAKLSFRNGPAPMEQVQNAKTMATPMPPQVQARAEQVIEVFEPSPEPIPVEVSPIEVAADDEDPFGTVAVVAEETPEADLFSGEAIQIDEPAGNGRAEAESLLAGTREIVKALEAALARARDQERQLADRLSRLQ